jgi:D-glycero-alpha-D-manno-heptose 1-phosphate guanylyltransferase
MIEEAIILAGGMGTRLKDTIKDLPKPMAPINGRPFLAYILDYLCHSGLKKVILSIGFKSDSIIQHFAHSYGTMELVYAIENEPLGTGGGILLALDHAVSDEVLILNGDTFFNVPVPVFYDFHKANEADISLALKPMKKFDRYGAVTLSHNRINGFHEKKWIDKGLINGGCYLLKRNVFEGIPSGTPLSFEKEILEKNVSRLCMAGFVCDGYFIDIGVPVDYARANRESEMLSIYK